MVGQLERQRAAGRDIRYQVNSATLEQVFLDLNAEKEESASTVTTLTPSPDGLAIEMVPLETSTGSVSDDTDLDKSGSGSASEKDLEATYPSNTPILLALSPGTKRNVFLATPIDAFTIAIKRAMVFRRAWLLPIIGFIVTIAASAIPLGYMTGRVQTCALVVTNRRLQRLSYPSSVYPVVFSPVVVSPSSLFAGIPTVGAFVRGVANNASFVSTFSDASNSNISYGGISLPTNPGTSASLFAYEASAFTQKGQSVLNFLTNQILNAISPPTVTGTGVAQASSLFRIDLSFRFMAAPDFSSTILAIKWLGFL